VPGTSITTITSTSSTARELLIYLYDLSPLDADIFFRLLKDKRPMKLEELTRKIDRDKTNIFRSLQRLVNLGLCTKEIRTLQNGGYYHIYSAINIHTSKTKAEKRMKELQTSLYRILRKFENDIEKIIAEIPQ
jgi:predicted transcriptional regulator